MLHGEDTTILYTREISKDNNNTTTLLQVADPLYYTALLASLPLPRKIIVIILAIKTKFAIPLPLEPLYQS